jgi:hypothetical protein
MSGAPSTDAPSTGASVEVSRTGTSAWASGDGSLTAHLRSRPPGLHGDGGSETWGLAWGALEWLEREVKPGMRTIETGSGASTIVLAARGALHEAVTPDPAEESRIRATCASLGIDSSGAHFRIGPSHEVLPGLEQHPLDLALIDGAHGFPYPVIDWWAIAPRIRVGGRVLLDDAYMPPVTMILDGLRGDPSWEVEGAVGYRTVILRRTGTGLPHFDWDGRGVGGRMTFRYLPPGRRLVASARHRFFSTRLGLRIVELARRDAGLRFRKTG